jgi:hypothetical protein
MQPPPNVLKVMGRQIVKPAAIVGLRLAAVPGLDNRNRRLSHVVEVSVHSILREVPLRLATPVAKSAIENVRKGFAPGALLVLGHNHVTGPRFVGDKSHPFADLPLIRVPREVSVVQSG